MPINVVLSVLRNCSSSAGVYKVLPLNQKYFTPYSYPVSQVCNYSTINTQYCNISILLVHISKVKPSMFMKDSEITDESSYEVKNMYYFKHVMLPIMYHKPEGPE